MRKWLLSLLVVPLAGCAQLVPEPQPTALPGHAPAGIPTAASIIAGEAWQQCTPAELDRYPKMLDLPSQEYYAGPWCEQIDGGVRYLWAYARPLTDHETPRMVRRYVNEDAGLLVRNLRTTGYIALEARVNGPHDVFYLGRRPPSPNVVSVAVLGDDPPAFDTSYQGEDPLRVMVTLRKAGPDEGVTPSPTSTLEP